MKHFVYCLILLSYNTGFAQYEKKGVVIEDRLLTWDDFKGRHESDAFKARTATAIQITPREVRSSDPIPEYKAICYFLPKESTVSSRFLKNEPDSIKERVLKHEQGHYYLTRIATAQMNDVFHHFPFTQRRSVFEADSIFRAVYADLRKIQIQYDNETNHSMNYPEQDKWDKLIEEGLLSNKLPIPSK